jgi:type IV pilus biogenesis protein CpaD/CtpE
VKSSAARVLLGLLLAALLTGGCASTDPDNVSQRPWNAPKSWETGLPTSILEGR